MKLSHKPCPPYGVRIRILPYPATDDRSSPNISMGPLTQSPFLGHKVIILGKFAVFLKEDNDAQG
jgi:hypothetical protein